MVLDVRSLLVLLRPLGPTIKSKLLVMFLTQLLKEENQVGD